MISTFDSILGLVVPTSKKELPYVLKLANLPLEVPPIYGLGLYKGYAALEGGGVRFGYSWGDSSLDGPTYHNYGGKLNPINGCSCAAFDEETGRFIGVSSKRATLVDFNRGLP